MRKIISLSAFVAMVLFMTGMVSCKKGDDGAPGADGAAGPAGPQGPAGAAGAQGPIGISGNANVMQYTYANGTAGFNYTGAPDGAGFSFYINTTQDTLNNSAWFAYLINSTPRFYSVPGSVSFLASDNVTVLTGNYTFSYSWAVANPTATPPTPARASFIISKSSGTGSPFLNARIVRIYFSNPSGGRVAERTLPDIDFKDYEAVKKYYNLP